MRSVIMHAPGDVRIAEREHPSIIKPTDAIIRVTAACVCGSDLWPYRGVDNASEAPMGHEVPAGQSATVGVRCDPRLFRKWDATTHAWARLGAGELLVARGLGDIRARLSLT